MLLIPTPAFSQITSKKIESFERYEVNQFPTYFKTWPLQRSKAKQVYQIKTEGQNQYLSAEDLENLSVQIFREFDWKIQYYPYLKWRWRANHLPEGANETEPEKNDSACGIYIIFGKTTGTALKFTWSTTLPVGTIYEKKPGELVFKILDSGTTHLHQWQSHSIPIPALYEELLKTKIKRNPTGIAILTDGNAVQKPAACDYDDFEISAVP